MAAAFCARRPLALLPAAWATHGQWLAFLAVQAMTRTLAVMASAMLMPGIQLLRRARLETHAGFSLHFGHAECLAVRLCWRRLCLCR